jgi:excisionase family DNA binding protein
MDKLAVSVPEAAKMVGVGLNTMRDLTHTAGFPAVRVSANRIVIPVDKLKEWLENNIGKYNEY